MEDLSNIYAQEKSAWLYILDLLADGNVARAEERIQAAVPTGIYRHFKSSPEAGERLYLVKGFSRATDSREYQVNYHPYYGEKRGKFITRSLLAWQNGFLVPVRREGYSGPRFTRMKELTAHEYGQLLIKLQQPEELPTMHPQS